MNRALNFFGGMLLGALVGVTLVLLLAPRSGAETQEMIQNRVQAIMDEGRQAAEARRL
jgi:gas vesicle protein